MFRVSFAQKNVQIGDAQWLFPRRHRDRFEWIALLAYRRVTLSHDGGWVSRDDIARLPKWSGKIRKHIGDNISRYLQDFNRGGLDPVEAKSLWTGPYRLTSSREDVTFDLSMEEVAEALCILPLRPEIQRDDLIRVCAQIRSRRAASSAGKPNRNDYRWPRLQRSRYAHGFGKRLSG